MIRPVSARQVAGRRAAGFTMIEVLVATTVLVVALAGSLLSQMASRKLDRTARETHLAVDEVQNAMEEVLARTRVQIVDGAGPYAPGQPIASYTDRVLDDERVVATYPGWVAGQPVPDVLEIRMTINWTTFDRRQRSLEVGCATSR